MDPQLDPVIAETNDNRLRFEAFCRSLGPAQLEAPVPSATWCAKDYIAHLATIDIWVGDWFGHLADGKPWLPAGESGAAFSIDTWNEAQIVERREMTVAELLSEAAGHRARLWATVDRFSPEVLANRFDFHENNITYLRYLQLWAGHDPAHAADMLRAFPERRADGALVQWLAAYRL